MKGSFIFAGAAGLERVIRLLSGLPQGKRWRVEWREAEETRRTAQNNLLWKWNGEIQRHMQEHTGQVASADEWHEILCQKLMPAEARTLKLPDGTAYESGRWRSSKASVREMTEYLNLLDQYCTENLGLLLTHPDDIYHEAMSRRGNASST